MQNDSAVERYLRKHRNDNLGKLLIELCRLAVERDKTLAQDNDDVSYYDKAIIGIKKLIQKR